MAERLSGMDSSFLSLETAQMPQHVMGVMVLDPTGMEGGYSFDLFRQVLLDRIHLMKPLRKRYVEVPLGLDHGVWVDDADFDVDDHLHHVQLEAPATRRDLEQFVGGVAAPVLDRSRPLWDMWVVEGLEDGRVAVVTKMHHSTMDGVTGADLMAHLFDLTPEPRDVEPPTAAFTARNLPARSSCWLVASATRRRHRCGWHVRWSSPPAASSRPPSRRCSNAGRRPCR